MSGYNTYLRWQRIEEAALKFGFRIGHPKHGAWGRSAADDTDVVSLFPKDDALPTYTRDAEIYTGTFSQVEIFLYGWERAQQYDMLLRLTDDKKRAKAEDKERERQRLEQERQEKKKMFAVLADKDADEIDNLIA